MSKKVKLLEDSSDSEVEFTINKSYADKYDAWRNKEELQKYKDLTKDDSDSSSSESDEVPDVFDEEFFRALSLVKGKDPRIYDKDFVLFKEKEISKKEKCTKEKPMYLKDYERKLILEKQGKFDDESDSEEKIILPKTPTYDDEQKELKESLKAALLDSDDDDNDNLLQLRNKTKEETAAEEADYLRWLKGEKKEVSDDVKQDMSYLRSYWNDPGLDEGEKFLRDYILNKRYLEKDDSEIPTYEEITGGLLSDEEKMIEEQEKFEQKYNFRFEEPDEEFIKRYPRTIGDSLRKVDTRRKQKREEIVERKKKEKEQKREELKRLKALKRKEIEEKFLKLKEVSGNDSINLNEEDIESDFDPDKHDQKMQELFNDEYYLVEETQKPEFPFDEELDSENWNNWAGEKFGDEDAQEDNVNEERNILEQKDIKNENDRNSKDHFEKEIIESTQSRKKPRKKSLFAKIISQPKPVYDPSGKSFEDYLDEYYKLDYEDTIGDMPVRFKYRKVIPNDFGLSVNEILLANDKELNRWCSVKKTCQYRNDDEELFDVQAFKRKSENQFLKQKVLASVYASGDDNDSKKSNVVNRKSKQKSEKDDDVSSLEGRIEVDSEKNDEDVAQDKNLNNFDSSVCKKKKKKKLKEAKRDMCYIETLKETQSAINFQDSSDLKIHSNVCVSKTEKEMGENKLSGIKQESSSETLADRDKDSGLESGDNSKNEKKRKKSHGIDVQLDVSVTSIKRPKNDFDKTDGTEYHSKVEPSANEIITAGGSKKRRRKRKNKQNSINCTSNSQNNKQTFSQNSGKHKFSKQNATDKRLALSDERLLAYGLNPKKFKNKIMYSNK